MCVCTHACVIVSACDSLLLSGVGSRAGRRITGLVSFTFDILSEVLLKSQDEDAKDWKVFFHTTLNFYLLLYLPV